MNDNSQPSVWPALRYDDAHKARRFLTEVFGFREALVVPDEQGDIVHAELRWPEGGGMMFGSTKHCAGTGKEPVVGVHSVYVVSDRVDAIHARAREHGAEIVEGLRDTDYGSYTFTARDPEGNIWTFGTYRGA